MDSLAPRAEKATKKSKVPQQVLLLKSRLTAMQSFEWTAGTQSMQLKRWFHSPREDPYSANALSGKPPFDSGSLEFQVNACLNFDEEKWSILTAR